MTVPGAHLILSKACDEVALRIEEVVPLTTPVSQLGQPALAGGESKTVFPAADVMNYSDRMMKLIHVSIADRITS